MDKLSSESLDKKHQDILRITLMNRELFNMKHIVIPFSLFFKQQRYIYSGEEKISFKMRYPEYKAILLEEFTSYVKEKI